MKKFLFFAIAIVLISTFTVISYASVDETFEVKVVSFKGDVRIDAEADGTWTSPWVGMKLMKKAIIKTGKDSSIQIVFDPKGLNMLKIKENTRISVDKSKILLLNGSILARFKDLKPFSDFKVQTPNAVCGIRGSGMGVDYIQGMTVVKAFEDKVYVQGLDAKGNPVGKEVIIPEDWKARVAKGGKIEPPAELTENEKKIWDAWIAVIKPTVPEEKEAIEEPGEPERLEGSEYE